MQFAHPGVRIAAVQFAVVFLLTGLVAPPARGTEAWWPASLTVHVGDVTVRIDGPKRWTVSRIEFSGERLGIEHSAYGTAINIRNVGFLGSAHRLDVPGQPGRIEEEQVQQLRFFADGRRLTPADDTLTCDTFRFERDSTIRDVVLKSTLQISANQIHQEVRITTERDVDVKVLYPLMYAWTPSASAWLMGDDQQRFTHGRFHTETLATPEVVFRKAAQWAAIYDPKTQIGVVSVVNETPPGTASALQFIDAPGVYRKLYLVAFSDQHIPAGFAGTYGMTTSFFRADESKWHSRAKSLADSHSPDS